MLEKRILFDYEVEIDNRQTKEWYTQAEEWGCDCGDCQNFLKLAREKNLPNIVLEALLTLDIPPEKATYVCLLTDHNGKHLYQFSYRIAGNILTDNTSAVVKQERCCHETYPYGAPDFPKPHFDLEFVVELPWVLEIQRGE